MLEGRAFDGRDAENGAPSVIVNQAFVSRYYPQGAIGQRLALTTGDHQDWREIVGVVPNLGMGEGPGDPIDEAIYLPVAQVPASNLTLLAHASGPPLNLSAPVRDALRAEDPNLPLFDIATVQEGFERNTWQFRVFGSLFLAFGFAALFLATVGLYGVMAFSVSRRTQEIGFRMAVGAGASDVLLMVMRQGLWQIGFGLALGVGLGVALGSAMSLLLYRVSPYDPVVLIGITLVLTGTAMLACYVPARRASIVDPMVALRQL